MFFQSSEISQVMQDVSNRWMCACVTFLHSTNFPFFPGFRILLLVSQREAVRKAHDLGPKRAARLTCFLTAAAWQWQSALLQPWSQGDKFTYNLVF